MMMMMDKMFVLCIDKYVLVKKFFVGIFLYNSYYPLKTNNNNKKIEEEED